MPLLKLETTVALPDGKKSALLAALSKIVAGMIGKPEQYVMVVISPAAIRMSGNSGDAAFVDIRSIGGLNGDVNLQSAKDKREQVFGGVRNVLDNQVAKNVSRDAARQLENHLQNNTFYFAYLDPKKYPTKDESKTAKFEKSIGHQLDDLAICLSRSQRYHWNCN